MPGPPTPTDPSRRHPEPELVRRLRRRRERYHRRGPAFRAAWVTLAVLITVAGLVMLVFPGPAFIAIPVGLAMLSFEFRWAQRLLDYSLERAAEARERAQRTTASQRMVGVLDAAIVLAAAIATYVAYQA